MRCCAFALKDSVGQGDDAVGDTFECLDDLDHGLGGSPVVATSHGNKGVGALSSSRTRVLQTEDVGNGVAGNRISKHDGARRLTERKDFGRQGTNAGAAQERVGAGRLRLTGGDVVQCVGVYAPRHEHWRGRYGVWEGAGCAALERSRLLCIGDIGGISATDIVTGDGSSHWVVLGATQHRTTVPSSSVLGGTARGAVGDLVAVLLGHYHLAVLTRVRVGVDGAARSPSAETTGRGRGQAWKVGVVRGGARAVGRGVEGRGELWQARVKLEGCGLIVQAVVGVGRVRLFGGRRDAWVAGAAGRGRGLGADDGCRTVGLAKVCEGDLEGCVRRAHVPSLGVRRRV